VSSDLLRDFASSAATLSVWRVEDDRSNLDIVLTGFTAVWDKLDKLDFVLLDYAEVEAITGTLAITDGSTPFKPAVAEHRDITNLTIGKLVRLIEMTRRRDERFFQRKTVKEIATLLDTAITDGTLDASTIKPKLHEDIKKHRKPKA